MALMMIIPLLLAQIEGVAEPEGATLSFEEYVNSLVSETSLLSYTADEVPYLEGESLEEALGSLLAGVAGIEAMLSEMIPPGPEGLNPPVLPAKGVVVQDVPYDQGRQLKISWNLPPYDPTLDAYVIYRLDPTGKLDTVGTVAPGADSFIDNNNRLEKIVEDNTDYVGSLNRNLKPAIKSLPGLKERVGEIQADDPSYVELEPVDESMRPRVISMILDNKGRTVKVLAARIAETEYHITTTQARIDSLRLILVDSTKSQIVDVGESLNSLATEITRLETLLLDLGNPDNYDLTPYLQPLMTDFYSLQNGFGLLEFLTAEDVYRFGEPLRREVLIKPVSDKLKKVQASLQYMTYSEIPDLDGYITALEQRIDMYKSMINTVALIEPVEIEDYVAELTASLEEEIEYSEAKMLDNRTEYTYMVGAVRGDLEEVSEESEPGSARTQWFHVNRINILIAMLAFFALVVIFINQAKKGKELFLRKIGGLEAIDEAVGRATEMGRPILFVPGLSGISDVATIAALNILQGIAKKAAQYDTPIIVPNRDPIVYTVAREIVKEAYSDVGRPDAFNPDSVFFLTSNQFAYVSGVNGIMLREKPATNFFLGMFWAESLLLAETGNISGAIQIAGTDASAQLPFFITACDYTIIGEELYAASAYLSREPNLLGTIKAQDYGKAIILGLLVVLSILAALGIEFAVRVLTTV